jgi:hypothetical protein
MPADPVALLSGLLWLVAGAVARTALDFHADRTNRRKRARGVG